MKTRCKICFAEYYKTTLGELVFGSEICSSCLTKMKPCFLRFKLKDFSGLAIYPYDEMLKTLIFQFKGGKDYELKDIFLKPYSKYLRSKYRNYIMVPIPSVKESDEARGFNHVEAIFEILNLPICHALYKTGNIKQANQPLSKRKKITEHLFVKNDVNLTNLDILIVDDVLTTGNSVFRAIQLVQKMHPKSIKILVLSINCRFLKNFDTRKLLDLKVK